MIVIPLYNIVLVWTRRQIKDMSMGRFFTTMLYRDLSLDGHVRRGNRILVWVVSLNLDFWKCLVFRFNLGLVALLIFLSKLKSIQRLQWTHADGFLFWYFWCWTTEWLWWWVLTLACVTMVWMGFAFDMPSIITLQHYRGEKKIVLFLQDLC